MWVKGQLCQPNMGEFLVDSPKNIVFLINDNTSRPEIISLEAKRARTIWFREGASSVMRPVVLGKHNLGWRLGLAWRAYKIVGEQHTSSSSRPRTGGLGGGTGC